MFSLYIMGNTNAPLNQRGIFVIFTSIMQKQKEDYSFWTKYKQFAGNEIMLYVIMVIGIILGIIIFS